jgi:RimJ/RimL family protein N-acetyltransferase
MKNVIETERLFFRELLVTDTAAMFELDSDPAVVQYAGDKPLTHIDQARQRIESVMQQDHDFGIGRWAAVLTAMAAVPPRSIKKWLSLRTPIRNPCPEFMDAGSSPA